MLKGFKDFITRGNVVELAVAVVIGLAFKAVIDAFVVIILDLVGKAGGQPNFSSWEPDGIHVGAFITAVISFLIIAAAVYFAVVVPLNALAARRRRQGVEAPDGQSDEVVLLTEIRDALRVR